jgi:3D (Asp-Asp-Asp) domain-containing protein
MKDLVRGGALVLITALLAAIIYANGPKDDSLIMTDASHESIDTIAFNSVLLSTVDDDDSKLVKTTGSSRVAGAGASKGAFSASAYCFSGRTAMGHAVRRGLVAADPRVLRLGSRIYVNAGPWSGFYTVSDTGGAIKGKRLDIWVPSCSEARKFGRRSVQVFAAQ